MAFIESQHSVLRVLKFLGFLPFDFETMQINRKKIVYSVFVNVLFNSTFFMGIYFYAATTNNEAANSNTDALILFLQALCNGFAKVIVIRISVYGAKMQIKFLKALLQVESKIMNLKFGRENLTKFYRKIQVKSSIWVITVILMYTSLTILYSLTQSFRNPLSAFANVVLSLGYSIFSMHFLMILIFVHAQVLTLSEFHMMINLNLEKFFTRYFFYENEIENYFALIDEVNACIEPWNRCYGLMTFGCFIYAIGMISTEAFFSVCRLMFQDTSSYTVIDYVVIVSNIMWNVPFYFINLCISQSSYEIEHQKEKRLNIFSKYSDDVDDDVKKSIEKYLIYASKNDEKLTANGFFTIDRSLGSTVNIF
jgi:7tm Chemosensory receptor